jgi:hypothetical protein
MRVELTVIGMVWLAFLLSGCAGSKDPAGPDMPVFALNAQPPVITPDQNTVLSLTPTLPLDFEDLYGEWIYFSSSSEFGVFTPPTSSTSISLIDPTSEGYLYPQIWFQYGGPALQDTLEIILYGIVITQLGDTLAWNYCQIEIIPN